MRTPTPTHLNNFVRDAATWPTHKKKSQKRNRERKVVARAAQRERDDRETKNPSR